ncbi:peroxisomal nicotinamide adenine dinucleotide carrier isoform X2 [Dendrobium catenatum]|uniref:peroxisomal nicotinamide adenine dinucleotide carrier isoform X2 n=1 Tax=Dendrobium catenatum TaxID=906689 RepID=UPI0010A09D53|nr:peroxisomal nicotinamide adenine dinucleotide carrier isoform X2 [Dendrobium catenatum]
MSDALINGVSGAGGGIIAQLITYPLQTVNTRQQTERDLSKSINRDGTLKQMFQVVKQEGWGRLYGGLTPSLVGTAASQGVYYYFYQIFRDRAELVSLARQRKGIGDGSLGMLQSLVVASLAGSVNVLLTNPIWVIVTRMQIKELYDEAGLLGFWKGVFPTLIMVCNPAIQFMLYESMLKKLKKNRASNMKGAEGLTAIEIFLFGAVAKLGATVATYPLLVVKSRLQAKQGLHIDKRHRYRGTWDAITKMIRYEGLFQFYKGMGTKIVQSVFAAAVLFMIKEELVKMARLLLTRDLTRKNSSRLEPSRP